MNGRRLILVGLSFLFIGISLTASLSAATLPAAVRSGTSAADIRKPVQALIDDQIAKLQGTDPAVRQQARDAIIAEVAPTPQNPPSNVFLDVYADVLNAALKPAATNPDVQVRLCSAIVAARVSQAGNNSRLKLLVIDLLNDENEAVVLWALKASKFIIPSVYSNVAERNNDKLLPAFVKAAETHNKSGAIMQAAYDALRVEKAGNNAVAATAWVDVVPAVVDALQALLEGRLKVYADSTPAMPTAELTTTAFLVDRNVWATESKQAKAQRMRSVQLICDLVSLGSQRLLEADAQHKPDFMDLVNKASAAIFVVGLNTNDAKLQAAASAVKVQVNATPASLKAMVDALRDAVKATPDFAGLKPAPQAAGLAPATAPATGPSSAPASN